MAELSWTGTHIAGWYSPSANRFFGEYEVEFGGVERGSMPSDCIPMTYANETRQLYRMLELYREENRNLQQRLKEAHSDEKQ